MLCVSMSSAFAQVIVTGTVADEIEPFEYFVDFDEPIGDPISDEDLYGNK